ncbi:hypothetical protein QAD02_010328 [Eretmocerus hayati]|uniref:Uncharacterized protein n=1 Tax=Eretmocerus hayati TaxID=131215 RepID=A0ACC2NBX7_9HYME|nr:hypothetical protein QAD02_010328 [Eretmocerus hayati]
MKIRKEHALLTTPQPNYVGKLPDLTSFKVLQNFLRHYPSSLGFIQECRHADIHIITVVLKILEYVRTVKTIMAIISQTAQISVLIRIVIWLIMWQKQLNRSCWTLECMSNRLDNITSMD